MTPLDRSDNVVGDCSRSSRAFMWTLTFAAFVIALAAHARARRLSKRLETLTQMYWELKYEHSRLKAQVTRLDPEAQPPAAEPASAGAPTVGFVPLSSLKKP